MKHIIILLALCLLVVPSGHAQETNDFTLSQALRQAYIDNPTLNAARRELRSVHEQLPQALSGWRPNVQADFGLSNVDIDGDPQGPGSEGSSPKEAEISLNQPLYRGGSTVAATRAANNIIRAQNVSLLATQQNILSATVEAYMNVLRDESLLALSKQNRKVISEQLRATNDRFEEGVVTKTDVKQAEARLAGADADVIQLEGTLDSSRAVYKQIVGLDPTSLRTADIMPPLPSTLEDSLALAQNNSPSILVAQALRDAQEDNVDTIFGELLPQISLRAAHNETTDPSPGLVDDTSETLIGVFVTVPLYQSGLIRSQVREAKEEVVRRRIQITEAEREVEQQVISSWRAFQSAKAEKRARNAQVEAAEIAREGVYMEAAEGSRTVLDTLDADQELFDAQVSEVIASRNEVVAAYNLAAILGALTPDNLNFSQDEINLSGHLHAVKNKVLSVSVDK